MMLLMTHNTRDLTELKKFLEMWFDNIGPAIGNYDVVWNIKASVKLVPNNTKTKEEKEKV